MPVGNTSIIGILNITPDSFSDAGRYTDLDQAITHAKQLFEQGADIIDIGGDSSRPGSVCVGAAEEWRRIEPVLKAVVPLGEVSVDTHFAETAFRALTSGAKIINDISGGSDPDMFRIVASHNAKIAVMYSRCSQPHQFDRETPEDLLGAIKYFFEERLIAAERAGLTPDQLLFDPGMGAFLSDNPEDSLKVIEEIHQLEKFTPLLLGISRKGFLSRYTSGDMTERDIYSATLGAKIVEKTRLNTRIYLRVHNVQTQVQALQKYSA